MSWLSKTFNDTKERYDSWTDKNIKRPMATNVKTLEKDLKKYGPKAVETYKKFTDPFDTNSKLMDLINGKNPLGGGGGGLDFGKLDQMRTVLGDRYKELKEKPQYRTTAMDEGLYSKTEGLADRLANTEIPSVAMAQHRQATDRGLKQAMALGASNPNNPNALRSVLNSQADLTQKSALDSALVRSQEAQRQAQQTKDASQIYSNLNNQRVDLNKFNTNTHETADQRRQENLSRLMSNMNQLERTNMNAQTAKLSADAQREGAQINALATGAAALIPIAAAASDKNLKKDFENPDDDIEQFLNMLSKSSKSYKYKDGFGLPKGEQLGPMAQDLEKNDLANGAVMDDPNGKMVDYGKLLPAITASLGKLHKDIQSMKGL